MTTQERAIPVIRPAVDILETPQELLLTADLPGADAGNLEVTLDRHVLTIEATVTPDAQPGMALSHREYELGRYRRAFTISNDIDPEGIVATIKNGLLMLTLPKRGTEVKQIRVKAG